MSTSLQNSFIRNPYIVGTPIVNQDQLFGRTILLRTIEDSLQQDAKFILLHGQRRIGKSSVLKNIPLFVSQDEFVFVPCDLQVHGYSTLGEILYAIANAIIECLNIDNTILNTLKPIDLDNNPKILTWRLLPTVYEALDNKKLVLLLDEFDVVAQDDTQQALEFLRFLEKLVKQQEDLFVIAVVGRYLNAMPSLVQSFRGAPFYEIGLLENKDTEGLITKPATQVLEYQEKTITEILKVSSGHPFCTQVLCHEIFKLLRNKNNLTNPTIVVPDHVLEVIPDAIESAGGGLDSIWKGLNISEKVVILAIAEAQKQNVSQNPFKLLEDYGLVLTDSLEEAIQFLINKSFLDNSRIKIKVELFRLWLLKHHQLRDEIKNLEALEIEKITPLLSVARSCWQEGKQQSALNLYEDVLQINPNHFSTIVELAEKYLDIVKFDKALELYERANKLNPGIYQQELIKALNQYGNWLINQEDYEKAKQQYNRIYTIEPGSNLAKQKLVEITNLQTKKNSTNTNQLWQTIKLPILFIILVLIGGAGIILIGRQLFNSCSAGQEKRLIFFCQDISIPGDDIKTRISRGDRTLFPNIENRDRDQGIDSFKKGNYADAVKYFEKAVQNNRNDPEVLIYQNNALAREKGNYLTLAAVVPANTISSGQEILRGIAQAQNQLRKQGGLKGRYLEIVIADDENREDTGKRVAEELVKDKSILGVIGHGSSHVTDAVLPIYTNAKLAVISSTSSSTKFQSPVFFRAINSNKETGKNLAEYIRKLNFKKIVIFCNPNDPYSNTMREEFRFFLGSGVEILGGGATCTNNLADSKLNVDREVQNIILDNNPAQAIVLFPDTTHIENAGMIAKTHKDFIDKLQQRGSNIKKLNLLGGDVLYNEEFLNKYSDALEGLVLSPPWFREASKSKTFAQNAEKQWGGGVSWRTATSFDAIQAFIESFRLSSNPSPKTVLGNLLQVKLSPDKTSGEELVFDKNSREMKRKETLIMLRKGKFVVISEPN